MPYELPGQVTEDSPEIVQSSLESRDEPNTDGTVARSSTLQGAVAYHFPQPFASLLSLGRNITIVYNDGSITWNPSGLGEKDVVIYNAPRGHIDICSKDPNTPSHNLGEMAPGKSLSRIDLTTEMPHGYEDRPEVSKYKCGNCGERSETEQAIRSHLSKNPFFCKNCKCFPSRTERDKHFKKYHITCRWCPGKFATDEDLNIHQNKKHWPCDEYGCEEWCRSWKDWTKHKAEVHPRCTLCPAPPFPSKQARDSHLEKSHSPCNICTEVLRDLRDLKKHKEDDHPFTHICEICDPKMGFRSGAALYTHQRKCHYVCKLVHRDPDYIQVFKYKDELDDHKRRYRHD